MTKPIHFQNLWRPVFVLILLSGWFALLDQANAQTADDSGLSMDVRPGFDGLVKNESWFPVVITLSNDGVAVEGTLELSITGNNDTSWETQVSLPTQSRKQVQATVYAPDAAIRTLEVVLKDESGNILLSSTDNNLKSLNRSDSLIYGVISPEPDALELLEKITAGRADSAVAFFPIDEIPTDPVAMQILDVLVFNDVDTNGLSAAQRETIEIWIQQGGQLVLTGGVGWQKTTAAFADLLPVEVSTTESVQVLSGFESAVGVEFRDLGPYVIAKSSLKSGELVWRDEATPILARRAEGAGNVWFLALDPQFAPLDDWDGSEALWESVAKFVPRPLFWERGFEDESSFYAAISTIPSIQLPSIWLILGFMGLYVLAAGPLNYIVLTQVDRRELAWLTLPVTIFLFSGIALLIGLQFRGNRLIINQLSVVSGRIDAKQLRVESAIGIYSPTRDELDVTFEPDTRLNFVNRFGLGGLSDSPTVSLGGVNILKDMVVSVGEVTPLTSSSYRGPSPVSGTAVLTADGDSFELALTNESSETIFNMLLLVGTKQVKIDDLAPGETARQEINIPSASVDSFNSEADGEAEIYQDFPGKPDDYQPNPLEPSFSTLIEGAEPGGYASYQYYEDAELSQRESLLNSLYETYDSETVYIPAGKLVLIGWSDVSQIDITLNKSRFDSAASSLYFIEIPVEK